MEYFLQKLIKRITPRLYPWPNCYRFYQGYGIIGIINFSHGDIFMIGNFIFDKKSYVTLPGYVFYKWSKGKYAEI